MRRIRRSFITPREREIPCDSALITLYLEPFDLVLIALQAYCIDVDLRDSGGLGVGRHHPDAFGRADLHASCAC
jgi:hypothetical protein